MAFAGALVDAPVPTIDVCSVAGTLIETVGCKTVELATAAPVGATYGAVPLETTLGTTTTAEAGALLLMLLLVMVALALLMGKLADGMRLAFAGAWGWPSAIWEMAVMVVVEGDIVVAEEGDPGVMDAADETMEAADEEAEEEEEPPAEGLLMPNWVVYWYWPVASTISWMP